MLWGFNAQYITTQNQKARTQHIYIIYRGHCYRQPAQEEPQELRSFVSNQQPGSGRGYEPEALSETFPYRGQDWNPALSLCLKAHHQDSPLVLQKGCNVAGLVAGGSTGINDMGAWWGSQQHGWEAAGLAGQKMVGSRVSPEPQSHFPTAPPVLPTLSCRMRWPAR